MLASEYHIIIIRLEYKMIRVYELHKNSLKCNLFSHLPRIVLSSNIIALVL